MTRWAGLLVLVCACDGTTTGDTNNDTDGGTGPGTQTEAILALTPDPVNGETVFDTWCTACHGSDGAGLEGFGKDIRGNDSASTVATFFDPPDGMTDFTGILSDQDMADVAGFIETGL